MIILSEETVIRLAMEVVRQACLDYKNVLRGIPVHDRRQHWKDGGVRKMTREERARILPRLLKQDEEELEEFFRSQAFGFLFDMDGEEMIRALREEYETKTRQRRAKNGPR